MERGRKDKGNTPFSCLQIGKKYSTKEAKSKNFVFSPYSIQLALSLLTNGSTGSTRVELLTFLEAESTNDLNSNNKEVLDLLCNYKKGDPILSFIGGVWIDQSLTIKSSFKHKAAKVYNAKAERVDFKDKVKSKVALQKVNRWAEESTNGLIKSIFHEDDFDPARRMLLGNALYFKGRWKHGFDPWDTEEKKFYLLGGNSVDVPSMFCDRDQQIATFDTFKILQLGYKCESYQKWLSMYILLPNDRDGLWSLIDLVGTDPLFMEKYISAGIEKVRVGKFMLPKFKIEYGFDAKMVLEKVGLKLPFSTKAELNEMMAHGANCPVSSVLHKSYIDVNEEGTEAAGVTVVQHVMVAMAPPKRPKARVDFVVDHPFMFMVRDDNSGAVLFMGHIFNPLLK